MAEQYSTIRQNNYFKGIVIETINMNDSLYNKVLTYVDLNNGRRFSLNFFTGNKPFNSKLNEFHTGRQFDL